MFWEVSPLPPIVLAWWGVRQVQRESSVENTKPALCCVCILMSSNKSNLLALHSALLCVFKYMAGPPSANRAIIPRLATGGLTLVTVPSSKDLIPYIFDVDNWSNIWVDCWGFDKGSKILNWFRVIMRDCRLKIFSDWPKTFKKCINPMFYI